MVPARITEVSRLSSRCGGEPLPVVADLADERAFLERRPVAVSVQLNIDTPRCNPGDLAGRHQLQHAQAQDLRIVHAQFAGHAGSELVLLRSRVISLAGGFEKNVHHSVVVSAGGQVEHAWNAAGGAFKPSTGAAPEEITHNQVEDREGMVAVVSGLIDGGGKPELTEQGVCKLVEIMKAIVEGDDHALGGQTA